MNATNQVLREENPISLCSAFVLDDGYEVTFGMRPRNLFPAFRGDPDGGRWKSANLYRRRRSFLSRMTLAPRGANQEQSFAWSRSYRKKGTLISWFGRLAYRRFLISLEKDLKAMEFTQPPEMRLLWTDPGDSVALFLEGQPWAFFHRDKNDGYSKGVLRPGRGNTWDEGLFQETFGGP